MKNFLSLFNRTDLITFIYCLVNIFYILFGYNSLDNSLSLLISFINISVLLIISAFLDNEFNLVNPKKAGKIFRFIHLWYAPIMYGFFFEATSKVNRIIFSSFLDPIFQHFDFKLFSYQPAIVWGTAWDFPVLQEILHFSYFSYYLMILGVPLYLYLKSDLKHFKQAIFNISFVFYSCYIIYMFLPVIGGRALEGAYDLTIQYRYGLFTHIMAFIYRNSAHLGGAFPSSHVAVALTITLIAFKHLKYMKYILPIVAFLLTISTVYCHYHYFVDALAGIFYGSIMFFLSEKIYKRLKIIDKKV